MPIKNTKNQYGIVAIILHWLMAILLIAQIVLGLYMVNLAIKPYKFKYFDWHEELGILILFLVCIRISWRLSNITPYLQIPLWEKIAARTVHWALYVFMFAMPLTGWIITSAGDFPVSFFGLFTLPALIAPDKHIQELFQKIHIWLGFGLIATIILHTLAAFKHYFIDKDDIMQRMLR